MENEVIDVTETRQRLIGRIAFGVVVLAGLLMSLMVFDYLNAPPEPSPSMTARPKVPVVPTPPPMAAKPEASEPAANESPKTAVAEESSLPKGASEPLPSEAPAKPPVEKPLTPPATSRHALMRQPEPTAVPAPYAPPSVDTRPRSTRTAEPPAVVRPLAQAAERPFAVQVGVFADVANAEELRARLEQAGIRSSIEARVHVGPFASRAEADAARVKLRELGIVDTLLFSLKARSQR